MARPQRNNVDYFPFLCEDGNKMFYLEETYGNDGFAVFIKLLRELARTDYHYLDLSKPSTKMFLSAKCKVSKEVLESIIKDLVDLEKFDAELWNENSIIWCQDFIDSIQDAYSKRTNNCIDRNSLLQLLISKGLLKPSKRVRKPNSLPLKGVANPQSIEDDSIEDDSIVNKTKIPTFEDFKIYAIKKKKNVCIDSLNLKYESWIENDWMNGNNKKIKNWKTTLLNTLPYIKEKDSAKKETFSESVFGKDKHDKILQNLKAIDAENERQKLLG